MSMKLARLLIIGMSTCLNSAYGGHIEISANLRNPTDGAGDLAGDMRLIFDTDAAPSIGEFGQFVFEATHCDLHVPLEGTSGVPFSIGEPNAIRTPDFTIARLEYFPGSNVYQVTVARSIDNQPVEMSLVVEHPASGFSSTMVSLPDAPEAYAFAGSGFESVYVNLDIGQEAEFAIWSTDSSFGAFSYSTRVVDIATDSGCSPADLDMNGSLNFFDVSAFLNLFNQGCP